ncbi:hypothetical protein [Komagataeibacter diospyri]|uniref:hypothetical protein n=1 Tax=Komagataeibacter diospyri TaxID=1932662 RepID=UPI0037569987
MLAGADSRAVEHHVFIVMVGCWMPENLFMHVAFASAAKPSVRIPPVTEVGGQITSGDACSIMIQHGKQMVICGHSAGMAFMT